MIYPNGDEDSYVVTVFDAEVIGSTPRLDGDETSEVEWWAPDRLPKNEMSVLTRALLRDAGIDGN